MLLLPALYIKTAAGKRSFAPIVKEKLRKEQYRKKYSDPRQREEARNNIAGAKIAKVNEFSSGHCQAKNKNPAR